MFKIVYLLSVMLSITGLNAVEQNHWFYSPYSKKLQPLSKLRPLTNNKQEAQHTSSFHGQFAGFQQKQPQKPTVGLQGLFPNALSLLPVNDLRSLCQGRQPEEKVVHPINSNQFVVCHQSSEPTLMKCPNGLVFNVNTLNCENSLRMPRGCSSSPCKNNGKCIDLPFFKTRCECAPGFSGDFCGKTDTCSTSTCGPNGNCVQLPVGSPVGHFCMCDGGLTYGLDCSLKTEPNPCLSNEADLKFFGSLANPAIFVHCEGHLPHLKFCNAPLVYSHKKQDCDWFDQKA